MKKNRICVVLSMLCVVFIFMTGCGGKVASGQVSSTPAVVAETSKAMEATKEDFSAKETKVEENKVFETASAIDEKKTEQGHEVTDSLGRTVMIPASPERILALNSKSMEALFNLEITPVGKIEGYKIREEGVALPSVGTPAEVNIEKVCQLEPDLIFAQSRFHSGMIEELELSGAAVYCFDPNNIDTSLTMYLGKVLGKEEEAVKYNAEFEKLCTQLREEVQGAEEIRTGIIIQNGDTIKAAQTASGYGALLKWLGIDNIVPDDLPNASKASFIDFDLETIILKDPDLILVVSVGGGHGAGKGNGKGGGKGGGQGAVQKGNSETLKKYLEDPQWSGMRAVQNGRLIILPGSVNNNNSTESDMIITTAECILKAIQNQQ